MFHVMLLAVLAAPDSEVISRQCTVTGGPQWMVQCVEDEILRTPSSFDMYADRRYEWNSRESSFSVLEAWTRTPDGRVVKTPQRAINVVTPRDLRREPMGTAWRVTVVSHVGLVPGSRGSVTHTRWRMKYRSTPSGGGVMIPLTDPRPVRHLRIRFSRVKAWPVDLPAGCRLAGDVLECRNLPPAGTRGMAGRHHGLEVPVTFTGPRLYLVDERAFGRQRTILARVPDMKGLPVPGEGLSPEDTYIRVLSWLDGSFRHLPGPLWPRRSDATGLEYRAIDPLTQALAAKAVLDRRGIPSRVVLYSRTPSLAVRAILAYPHVALISQLSGRQVVYDLESGTIAPYPGILAGLPVVSATTGPKKAPNSQTYSRSVSISYTFGKDGSVEASAEWLVSGRPLDGKVSLVPGRCITTSSDSVSLKGQCTWKGQWTSGSLFRLAVPPAEGFIPNIPTSWLLRTVTGLPVVMPAGSLIYRVRIRGRGVKLGPMSWGGQLFSPVRTSLAGASYITRKGCTVLKVNVLPSGRGYAADLTFGCHPQTRLVKPLDYKKIAPLHELLFSSPLLMVLGDGFGK